MREWVDDLQRWGWTEDDVPTMIERLVACVDALEGVPLRECIHDFDDTDAHRRNADGELCECRCWISKVHAALADVEES
jgi:hypothetical protein